MDRLQQLSTFINKSDLIFFVVALFGSCSNGIIKVLRSVLTAQTAAAYVKINAVQSSKTATLEDLDSANAEFSAVICMCALKFLLLAGLSFGLKFIGTKANFILPQRIMQRIRVRHFEVILNKDIAWHERDTATKGPEDSINATFRLGHVIRLLTGPFAFRCARVVFALVYAIYLNWWISLIFLIFFPAIAWAEHRSPSNRRAQYKKMQEIQKKATAIFHKALLQVRLVQSFNGQRHEINKYTEFFDTSIKQEIEISKTNAIRLSELYVVMNLVYFVLFWLGTDFVYFGYADAETVLIIFNVLNTMSFGIGNMLNFYQTMHADLMQSGHILDELCEVKPTAEHHTETHEIQGKITFQNVCFSYPSRPHVEVLKGISFECLPGETIALVGSTGSGKTTILNLLLRFYEPSKGQILFDGTDSARISQKAQRAEIGFVSQEPVLFNRSIRENLLMVKPDASEAELYEVLAKANALEFVKTFPQGIDTNVGERGHKISGGEKQRIAIARVLLRNPRILLLDEATSALDSENEKAIKQALQQACFGRTTIIVAHRLSTVRHADKIFVIENGRVAEYGSHNDLIALNGAYCHLINSQIFMNVQNPHKIMTKKSGDALSTTSEDSGSKSIEFTNSHVPLWSYVKYLGPYKKYLFIGIFMALLEGIVPPIYGLFFTDLYSGFSNPNKEIMRKEGHAAAWNFIYLTLFEIFRVVPIAICFSTASSHLNHILRLKVFENLLQQNASFFDQDENTRSELFSAFNSITNIKMAYGELLGSACKASFAIVLALYLGFSFDWRMTILMCIVILISSSYHIVLKRLFDLTNRRELKLLSGSFQVVDEAILNIKTVVAMNLEPIFMQEFIQNSDDLHENSKRQLFAEAIIGGTDSSMPNAVDCAAQFGAVFTGATNYLNVLRCQSSIRGIADETNNAMQFSRTISKANASAAQIDRLLKLPQTPNQEDAPIHWSCISFKNLSFAYTRNPSRMVLRDISFRINKGEKIGITGPSGSGKSTLVALLHRFYEPSHGQITINDTSISNISLKSLRNEIAVVQQEPTLFNESIFSNISYGMNKEYMSMKDVEEAATIAGIHNFVTSLPNKYETIAGELGSKISGGQKQRIAIARALIRKPKVVVFDEATSALDMATEHQIQEALYTATLDLTTITIAHRIASIRNCDRILVLDKGALVEQGSHNDLIALNGLYAKMIRSGGHFE